MWSMGGETALWTAANCIMKNPAKRFLIKEGFAGFNDMRCWEMKCENRMNNTYLSCYNTAGGMLYDD